MGIRLSRPKRTKRDINHAQVRDDCRALGMVVWDLADYGGKIFDLLCCWRGRCVPVEVKQPGHEQELTDAEQLGIAELRTVGIEVVIATCAEDVIRVFGE